MARKTTLSAENLATLGAKRLSELLMEFSQNDAVAKRRLRIELSAKHDPSAVAREVRKRINTLARSRAFVEWDKTKSLVKDLDAVRRSIIEQVAPIDALEAYDLIWRFMALARPTMDRCDDSNGNVGEVFSLACENLGQLALTANIDSKELANRCVEAMFANDFAQFDGLVPAVASALGGEGLKMLRSLLQEVADQPADPVLPDGKREVIGWSPKGALYRDEFEAKRKEWVLSSALREIADALGDVDAYMAQYDGQQRRAPRIAAELAERLLDADRAEEALALLEEADVKRGAYGSQDWEGVYIKALEATGRKAAAQNLRLEAFEARLDRARLKEYLERLADFEDVEAEEQAIDHARQFPGFVEALSFLTNWPALEKASDLVLEQVGVFEGDAFYILGPAAEKLAGKFPLAASLLLRSMIDYTLAGARSKRYGHAARHLLECESLAGNVSDWHDFQPHADYYTFLKQKHGRKHGFWSRLK